VGKTGTQNEQGAVGRKRGGKNRTESSPLEKEPAGDEGEPPKKSTEKPKENRRGCNQPTKQEEGLGENQNPPNGSKTRDNPNLKAVGGGR